MISDGLFSLLVNSGAIQTIVGAARSDKTSGIFKVQMPEGAAMPALVFFQVSASDVVLDGRARRAPIRPLSIFVLRQNAGRRGRPAESRSQTS